MWALSILCIAGAFCSALVVSLYVAPYLIAAAYRLNFLDSPHGLLKNHKEPTPYMGGLVVYIGFIVSLIFFFPFQSSSIFFILGSTLLLIVGLIDDCVPLKPHQKFLGQVIAVICFAKGGLYLKELFFLSQDNIFLAYLCWVPISCFWMLSIINAINLIDVMDGLATTTALLAASSFFVVSLLMGIYSTAILLAGFIGALIGFLWFNKPPARIYLGDAGSLFIGGVLATIPFMIPWGTFSWYGYFAPVALLIIPALELGTLIVIRTAQGIPFYKGSPHHFSHFLRAHQWSVSRILAFVLCYSIVISTVTFCFLLGLLNVPGFFCCIAALMILWYLILLLGPKAAAK